MNLRNFSFGQADHNSSTPTDNYNHFFNPEESLTQVNYLVECLS